MFNINDYITIEQLVILNPKKLLEHLHHILSVLADDKLKWGRVHSTGFISASDFCNLAQCRDTAKMEIIVGFLECSGLIFRRPKQSNVVGLEFFVPYFAQVPSSTDAPPTDKKDSDLFLQFVVGHESTQTYFELVFGLANSCDNPSSLVVHANNCCMFTHSGYHITVFHQKLQDRIKFIFKRYVGLIFSSTPDSCEKVACYLHRTVSTSSVSHNWLTINGIFSPFSVPLLSVLHGHSWFFHPRHNSQ